MSPNRKLSDRRAKQETPKEKSSEPKEKIEWPKSEKRGAEEKNNEPEEKIERPKSEKKKRQRKHWATEERKKRRRREKQCRMHTKNFNALFGSTLYYAQCHSCFKFRWFGLKHITLFTMSRVIQICWIMHNATFASRMFFFGWEHINYSQCHVCGRPHKLQASMK